MTAEESLSYLQNNEQLKGWRPAPYRVELSRSVPYEHYQDGDVVTLEIREIKGWAWGENIDREEYRDVTFAELRNGAESATYSMRFTRVRDPDLNDLDHVRAFL